MARTLKRSAIVHFSPEQMYQLVNDIAAYPQFFPHCTGAKIIHQTESLIEAELTLTKGAIRHSFCTRNDLTPPHKMQLSLLSGPFRQFDGVWEFKALTEGCEVSFELTFEFSNPLLNLTAGRWMENLASEQVDVICQRANIIYAGKS